MNQMKKRLLSLCLAFVMIASLIGTMPIAAEAAGEKWDGTTAQEAPAVDKNESYIITDGADLAWYAANGTNKSAILTANIDLDSKTWTSIAAFSNATLDGNGYAISGLTSPLINSLNEGGVVKNLTVDCTIDATTANVGAIACTSVSAEKPGSITNCTVNGTITSTNGTVGGVIGNGYGDIINCSNNSNITIIGNKTAIAGIVGKMNAGTVVPKISNCKNTGTITVTGTSNYSVAGISGIVGDMANNIVVDSCCNHGDLKLNKGGAVGGIVGQYRGAANAVKNSYNVGEISTSGINTGGISGAAYSSGNITIENSYNAGMITGTDTTIHSVFGKTYGTCTNVYTLENSTSDTTKNTNVKEQTAEELKALAATLGAAFKADDATTPTNNGYPVLVNAGSYAYKSVIPEEPTDETVEAVVADIDLIGTVSFTDECRAKIDAALNAYNALSDAQKAKVSKEKYDVLMKADQDYKANIEADVYVTAQAYNGFLVAPQTVTVKANLAESLGYTDQVTNAVSALDVLAAEHELVIGKDDFDADPTASLALGTSGWITTVFGTKTSYFGFAVNGASPNDGVETKDGYYTSYSINQAAIQPEDQVEFFIYQDSDALDYYVTNKTGAVQNITSGESVEFELSGYTYGWYSSYPDTFIESMTESVEDAQLAYVDTESGALTPIDGAVTDEDGKTSVEFDKAGTYLLTAYIPDDVIEDYATPIIMPLMTVNVKAQEIKEATAFVTAQSENQFFVAPQEVTVKSDLAESYGYKDQVINAVSALDVLVAENIEFAGKDKFEENKDAYLVVEKTAYGYTIQKLFGVTTINSSFTINEDYPSDGTMGYTITQAPITNGDKVEFFIYQDAQARDNYVNNKTGNEIKATVGTVTTIELEGYNYGWEGYKPKDERTMVAISDAQLAYVDAKTGALTAIDGAVTDETGKVAIKFDRAGAYYVTAYIPSEKVTEGVMPIIMPLMKVNVKVAEVKKTDINSTKVTLAKTAYTYTGKSIKPAVTVKNGSTTLKSGTDYTVLYTSNKNVGTAKVTITGKGGYTGSKTLIFKINPKTTKITKVVKGNKKLTLKWKKVSGVTGYKIYRSTSKNGKYKYIATVKNSKTSYVNKKLKANKKYYYKVVTYKKVAGKTYTSSYSNVKAGKTK